MLCKWKLKSRVYKYFPHSHQLSSPSSSWFHSILSLPLWAGVRRCWENDLSRLNSRETEEEENQHRTHKYNIAAAADNPRKVFVWRIRLFVTCNLRSCNINFFLLIFFRFLTPSIKWVELIIYIRVRKVFPKTSSCQGRARYVKAGNSSTIAKKLFVLIRAPNKNDVCVSYIFQFLHLSSLYLFPNQATD